MSSTPIPSLLSLKDAARHFSLAPRRLLSLGADGRLFVFAPVLNDGLYQWPTGQAGVAFPDLPRPVRRHFGAADRVQLSAASLKEIEGQGWSDVRSFVAIDEARQALIDAEFPLTLQTKRFEVRTSPGLGKTGYVVERLVREDDYVPVAPELEDWALVAHWVPVGGRHRFGECTTARHLFVDSRQVESLVQGTVAISTTHGNTVRNAEKREEVLAVALHLFSRRPHDFPNARKLAEAIDGASHKFWPVSRVAPLQRRSIEDLLQSVLADGKIRGRS